MLSAREPRALHADTALTRLCQTYWPPLYAFLRRKGCSPEDAEDLVQGYFEKLLARDYLKSVDRDKGRFRSFLLKSLSHHVANTLRDQRTQRRGGKRPHIALDDPVARARCEALLPSQDSAETVFDRVWAQTIMEHAAQELRREYAGSKREALYAVISRWLATDPQPGEYAMVAPELDLTEGALAAAVFRLRQRFRQLVRAQVSHTLQSPTDLDDEMRHLLRVLTDQSPA